MQKEEWPYLICLGDNSQAISILGPRCKGKQQRFGLGVVKINLGSKKRAIKL